MTATQDTDLTVLGNVSTRLCSALTSIEEHHWSLATPCPDWDLAALVDHVTGGNWFTSRILTGRSAEDAMNRTIELFDGTSVTVKRALSSVEEQITAFGQPGVLDRGHNHVVGDLTGRQVIHLRLHDLIIHTWDIEQTLHPPASVPEDLVRWGLEELADRDSLTAKHFDPGDAGIPHATGDGETAYLRSFGR